MKENKIYLPKNVKFSQNFYFIIVPRNFLDQCFCPALVSTCHLFIISSISYSFLPMRQSYNLLFEKFLLVNFTRSIWMSDEFRVMNSLDDLIYVRIDHCAAVALRICLNWLFWAEFRAFFSSYGSRAGLLRRGNGNYWKLLKLLKNYYIIKLNTKKHKHSWLRSLPHLWELGAVKCITFKQIFLI